MSGGELNPFAAPRAADEEARPRSAEAALHVLPDDARRELVRTAPVATWAGRLGVAALGVQLLQWLLRLGRRPDGASLLGEAVMVIVFSGLSLVILVLVFAQAGALRRLAAGDPRAVEEALGAQKSLLRFAGVTTIALVALFALVTVGAVVVGVAVGLGRHQ